MDLRHGPAVKEVGGPGGGHPGRRRVRGKPPYAYVGVAVPFGVTPVWVRSGHQGQAMTNLAMALATASTARISSRSQPLMAVTRRRYRHCPRPS